MEEDEVRHRTGRSGLLYGVLRRRRKGARRNIAVDTLVELRRSDSLYALTYRRIDLDLPALRVYAPKAISHPDVNQAIGVFGAQALRIATVAPEDHDPEIVRAAVRDGINDRRRCRFGQPNWHQRQC